MRLAKWVSHRSASSPKHKLTREEFLHRADQWLSGYFRKYNPDFTRVTADRWEDRDEDDPAGPDETFDADEADDALDLLESDLAKDRVKALGMLADLGDPDLEEWCLFALEDESIDARLAALEILRSGENVDVESVEPFTESENKLERGAALRLLARLDDDSSNDWYRVGLGDPDPHVRIETARELRRLPDRRQAHEGPGIQEASMVISAR